MQVIISQLARTRLLGKSLTRNFMVKGFLPYSVELLHSNDSKTRMIGCCMTACDVNSPLQVCRLLCMVERILLHCFCVLTSIVAAYGGISGIFCQPAFPNSGHTSDMPSSPLLVHAVFDVLSVSSNVLMQTALLI